MGTTGSVVAHDAIALLWLRIQDKVHLIIDNIEQEAIAQ